MSTRKSISISDLLKKAKTTQALPVDYHVPIRVKKEDCLPVAFQKLIDYRLHSLLVMDDSEGKAIGFLDLLDVLYYVLTTSEQAQISLGEHKGDMEFLRQELFSQVPCEDIINFSRKNPFIVVTGDTHLETTLSFMLESNVHRLPVLRPDGTIYGILGQSDIMKWIARTQEDCDALSELLKTTISDLGFCKEVITIQNTDSTKDAFYKIRESGVSGIGVLNPAGELVGNISAMDLTPIGIDSKLFQLLSLPLEQYMQLFLDKGDVITARVEDNLEKVLSIFNGKGVHRIYVLDSSSKLVGLVSPFDVIKLLLQQNEEYKTN